jgi:hypothetical protein
MHSARKILIVKATSFTGGVTPVSRALQPVRLLIVLLLTVPLLSACPSMVQDQLYKDYHPAPLVSNATAKTLASNDPFGSLVGALEAANQLNPQCFGPSTTTPTGGTGIAAQGCVTQRNYIMTELVAKSNDACQAHKATMFGNEASWNVTLGTLTNAFTGTAAVFGGPVGKSIFSALGLFSNAERSLVNEEVYQNLLVPAIGQKIDDIRSAKLTDINGKMKAGSTLSDYSMYQAISDVMEYHDDCSFMLGLQTALKEGTGSGVSTQYLSLKQTEQSLSSQIDLRQATIASAKPPPANLDAAYKADNLLVGLKARLDTVETQLKALESIPSSKPAGS